MIIKNVVLPHRTGRYDVLIDGATVSAIADSIETPPGVRAIDGTGKVLLPGFVDAHSHLDKSMLGRTWYSRQPRDLDQLLADERAMRSAPDWDAATQIRRNADVMIANGATHTRAFVDVDTEVGLSGVEGMLQVREDLRDALTMQIIAFAQSGVGDRPGTAELLDAALAAGADVVGGMDPCSYERDPVEHIDLIFRLAERHGAGVDIHLHEPGELGAFSAGLIIERAKAVELPRPVVISHPDFLGSLPADRAARIIDDLAEAGIGVTTCVPSGGPMPPLKALVEAGVAVGVGCDGQLDSWGPFNRSDMLLKVYLLAWRCGFGSDEDLQFAVDLATSGRVLGLPEHGFCEGSAADLVLLSGATVGEAVVGLPVERTVIKAGRVLAEET
ncbi:amidohydrolase family protein [Kribbella sp.]|uniref:amidohydrolase family protein n=1 Tax=Kribbella sp. TaxID=1871183 RepID=UPI002D291A4D|nr:amidohydrolase family protein [Kribbella sp.]HZX02090.1 amidohydrolase family protein [Kribbella sp.]